MVQTGTAKCDEPLGASTIDYTNALQQTLQEKYELKKPLECVDSETQPKQIFWQI